MTRTHSLSIALLGVALSLPAAASAQAGGMHEHAGTLQADKGSLTAIAQMHIRSARELGPGNPQSQLCLSRAAHLMYYAGKLNQARRLLIEAADVALQRGDVEFAAHTMLTAAVVAKESRDPGSARQLVERAERLAQGPSINPDQRAGIMTRISRPTRVAADRR